MHSTDSVTVGRFLTTAVSERIVELGALTWSFSPCVLFFGLRKRVECEAFRASLGIGNRGKVMASSSSPEVWHTYIRRGEREKYERLRGTLRDL